MSVSAVTNKIDSGHFERAPDNKTALKVVGVALAALTAAGLTAKILGVTALGIATLPATLILVATTIMAIGIAYLIFKTNLEPFTIELPFAEPSKDFNNFSKSITRNGMIITIDNESFPSANTQELDKEKWVTNVWDQIKEKLNEKEARTILYHLNPEFFN